MSFQINIDAGKDSDFSGVLEDATGTAISITALSDIIFKVFRGNPGTPDLDVNGTQLAGGTKTSFTAGVGPPQGGWTIKFFGADTLGLSPGVYDVQLLLVDAGDSNRLKLADHGTLNVLGTTSGKST